MVRQTRKVAEEGFVAGFFSGSLQASHVRRQPHSRLCPRFWFLANLGSRSWSTVPLRPLIVSFVPGAHPRREGRIAGIRVPCLAHTQPCESSSL